eukprot:gene12678-13979_t
MTFINKSGMEINVFYMDRYGYRRKYFDLRLNERKIIRSKVGTTWIAYSSDHRTALLLNKKFNFLVYFNHLSTKIKVVITAQSNVKVKPLPSIFNEKFIEIMVIADSTVYKKHGEKTEKYVLTLMNAVNRLFQDKSFGIKLNTVVTKVKILKKDPETLKIVKGAPKNSMTSACLYASTYHHTNSYHDNFDFTVILTRTRFGYAGLVLIMMERTMIAKNMDEKVLLWAQLFGHDLIFTIGQNVHESRSNKQSDISPALIIDHERILQNIQQNYLVSITTWMSNAHSILAAITRDAMDGASRVIVFLMVDSIITPFTGRGQIGVHGPNVQRVAASGQGTEPGNATIQGTRETCDDVMLFSSRPKYDGRDCEGVADDVTVCRIKPCPIERAVKDLRDAHCNSLGEGKLHWLDESNLIGSVDSIAGLNCSFDNTNNCSWRQDQDGDDFDWQKNKGSTPSYGTGPRDDHTFENGTGHYMYIEASDGQDDNRRKKGYRARLISPLINTPEVCFSFFYHMFGSHIGGLNVYIKTEFEEVLLWNRTKDLNDRWFFANVNMRTKWAFNIVIEGVRGTHYQGDIAIDDLSVKAGPCENNKAKEERLCKITCTDEDRREFIDAKLPDAFRCYDDNRTDICLGGECKKLGCDLQLGSNKTSDGCKICGGDGSTCVFTKGNATVKVGEDDETVLMQIPPGSTNLNLVIFAELNVDIGLREPTENQVYFPRKINGANNKVQPDYTNILGCTYRFEQDTDKGVHIVESEGPSNGIVELVMVAAKKPVSLQYRMFKSKNYYEWKRKKQSDCLDNCKDNEYACIQMPTGVESDEFNCPKRQPEINYYWHAHRWSRCSRTCGVSVKTRQVTCRRMNGENKADSDEIVDASQCIVGDKPVTAAYCRNIKCKRD